MPVGKGGQKIYSIHFWQCSRFLPQGELPSLNLRGSASICGLNQVWDSVEDPALSVIGTQVRIFDSGPRAFLCIQVK